MNRRRFLKWIGLTPALPTIAALPAPTAAAALHVASAPAAIPPVAAAAGKMFTAIELNNIANSVLDFHVRKTTGMEMMADGRKNAPPKRGAV